MKTQSLSVLKIIRHTAFHKKNDKLWGCDKAQWLVLGAINREVWEVCEGNWWKIRVILVGLFIQTGVNSQSLMIRMFFSSWYREDTFLKEKFTTRF